MSNISEGLNEVIAYGMFLLIHTIMSCWSTGKATIHIDPVRRREWVIPRMMFNSQRNSISGHHIITICVYVCNDRNLWRSLRFIFPNDHVLGGYLRPGQPQFSFLSISHFWINPNASELNNLLQNTAWLGKYNWTKLYTWDFITDSTYLNICGILRQDGGVCMNKIARIRLITHGVNSHEYNLNFQMSGHANIRAKTSYTTAIYSFICVNMCIYIYI